MTDESSPLAWINFWKPKDEWYYLERAERQSLLEWWEEFRNAAVAAGARRLGTFACRANSDWARVSLWEFPDVETLTEMIDELSAAGYYQYFAEDNTFGVSVEEPYETYMAAADAAIEMREE
jgi:hypothetical protein